MPDEIDEVEAFTHKNDESTEEHELLVEVEPVEVVNAQPAPGDKPQNTRGE